MLAAWEKASADPFLEARYCPTPPGAKLHQLPALFQQFPSSVIFCHAWPSSTSDPLESLRYAGALKMKHGVYVTSPPIANCSCSTSVIFDLPGTKKCDQVMANRIDRQQALKR